MIRTRKRILSFFLLLVLVVGSTVSLTGCHGQKGLNAFVIPEEFDTSREYEITFWANADRHL